MLKYENLYRRGCKDHEKFIKASKWIVTNKISGTKNATECIMQIYKWQSNKGFVTPVVTAPSPFAISSVIPLMDSFKEYTIYNKY